MNVWACSCDESNDSTSRRNSSSVEEIELNVEEMEEVIAPGLTGNHNETLDVDLDVEEMEEVIAPALAPNHNETLVSDAH